MPLLREVGAEPPCPGEQSPVQQRLHTDLGLGCLGRETVGPKGTETGAITGRTPRAGLSMTRCPLLHQSWLKPFRSVGVKSSSRFQLVSNGVDESKYPWPRAHPWGAGTTSGATSRSGN